MLTRDSLEITKINSSQQVVNTSDAKKTRSFFEVRAGKYTVTYVVEDTNKLALDAILQMGLNPKKDFKETLAKGLKNNDSIVRLLIGEKISMGENDPNALEDNIINHIRAYLYLKGFQLCIIDPATKSMDYGITNINSSLPIVFVWKEGNQFFAAKPQGTNVSEVLKRMDLVKSNFPIPLDYLLPTTIFLKIPVLKGVNPPKEDQQVNYASPFDVLNGHFSKERYRQFSTNLNFPESAGQTMDGEQDPVKDMASSHPNFVIYEFKGVSLEVFELAKNLNNKEKLDALCVAYHIPKKNPEMVDCVKKHIKENPNYDKHNIRFLPKKLLDEFVNEEITLERIEIKPKMVAIESNDTRLSSSSAVTTFTPAGGPPVPKKPAAEKKKIDANQIISSTFSEINSLIEKLEGTEFYPIIKKTEFAEYVKDNINRNNAIDPNKAQESLNKLTILVDNATQTLTMEKRKLLNEAKAPKNEEKILGNYTDCTRRLQEIGDVIHDADTRLTNKDSLAGVPFKKK